MLVIYPSCGVSSVYIKFDPIYLGVLVSEYAIKAHVEYNPSKDTEY